MSPSQARPRVVAGLRLLEQVGQGGEGEVWEARDRKGRRRALKLIRPDSLVSPDEVERRGRWLLGIEHPALVAVHRCGVLRGAGLDGWGFVEMDFIEGPSLDEAAADPGILDRLEPLAEALDLLHAGRWSAGVPLVHRDVKPANLLEDADGDLVLVDHSTLRDVDDTTRTRIGTPLFAAPEVVTGRAGPLADVYAFAATAVALLTGARRGDLAALLLDPWTLDVPAGLRAALADDPADRPVSCRAALDPSLPLVVGHEVGWSTAELDDVEDEAWDRLEPGPRPEALREDDRAEERWLPDATDVMLEPWHDWAGPPAARSSAWGWFVILAGILVAPGVVALVGPGPRAVAMELALGLGVVHLACHLLARRSVMLALLLPPVAWAFLLADRGARHGNPRAWLRAAVLTPIVVAAVPAAALVGAPERIDGVVAAALAAVALAGVAATLAAGGDGAWGRLLLLPLWLPGAAALVAGSLLLVPLGLVVDRAGDLLRLVAATVRGAAAMVRA